MDDNKKKYVLLSEKKWNVNLINQFKSISNSIDWIKIDSKENFNYDLLQKINPDKIFIPHWSYVIPEKIFKNFECILFHMTDLPYGRGGSPLQNLIVREHSETKISASEDSLSVNKLNTTTISCQNNIVCTGNTNIQGNLNVIGNINCISSLEINTLIFDSSMVIFNVFFRERRL